MEDAVDQYIMANRNAATTSHNSRKEAVKQCIVAKWNAVVTDKKITDLS